METRCLCCNEPIIQTQKKRKKIFCNSTCRSNFWQKEKRKQALEHFSCKPVFADKLPDPDKPAQITINLHKSLGMPPGLTASQQIQWKLDNIILKGPDKDPGRP